MPKTKLVFVYGTLRPPQADTVTEDSRYYFEVEPYVRAAIPARLPAAEIYDLGTYPGAISGTGEVQGDLLKVTPTALKIMDRLEGHPNFFRRAKTKVFTDTGTAVAWVYWAPRSLVIGHCPITGGDWFQRDRMVDSGGCSGGEDETNELLPVDDTLRQIVRRFAQAECSWFSTVRPDGRAHSVPVWHVWHYGRAYVVSTSGSVKAANLKQNPNVVIAHQDPVNPIIIEGWGTIANSRRDLLQPLFYSKYDWDLDSDSEYDTVIEITPLKFMAWGDFGEGRWTGDQVLRVLSL
jgi:gamma-glutamylcyclotransferase (GGCT)/AIG2-like uncharacterized protein YtfP/general stress protein 26